MSYPRRTIGLDVVIFGAVKKGANHPFDGISHHREELAVPPVLLKWVPGGADNGGPIQIDSCCWCCCYYCCCYFITFVLLLFYYIYFVIRVRINIIHSSTVALTSFADHPQHIPRNKPTRYARSWITRKHYACHATKCRVSFSFYVHHSHSSTFSHLVQIDQTDHDLSRSSSSSPAVVRGCARSVQYRYIQPRKHDLHRTYTSKYADYMAPTRHELGHTGHTDHTDHTDPTDGQDCIYLSCLADLSDKVRIDDLCTYGRSSTNFFPVQHPTTDFGRNVTHFFFVFLPHPSDYLRPSCPAPS